jgi:hypothetical protein
VPKASGVAGGRRRPPQRRREGRQAGQVPDPSPVPHVAVLLDLEAVGLADASERGRAVEVGVLYVDDRAAPPQHLGGDRFDVVVEDEYVATGFQGRPAVFEESSRIGDVVEHLEQADGVELRRLQQPRAHDIADDEGPDLVRGAGHGRGARFDPPNGGKSPHQRLLQGEAIAAADLEQRRSWPATSLQAGEIPAIRRPKVSHLVAIVETALLVQP